MPIETSEPPQQTSSSAAGQSECGNVNITSADQRQSAQVAPLMELVAERSVPRVNGRLIQEGLAFGTEGLIYQVKGMATRRQADKTSFKRFKSNVTNAPFEGT
jgi:hypothetical protein